MESLRATRPAAAVRAHLLFALLLVPGAARGQSPAPAPYSLPWNLRPVTAATVVRFDETLATFEDTVTGISGSTWVTSVIASRRLTPHLAPLVRITWVVNDPPGTLPSGNAFSNPLLGATWAQTKGAWRGSGFLAATIPVGQGGGASPDAGAAAAVSRGIPARSGMDNALFAVNFATVVAGAGLARVDRRMTAQAEATVLRLTRVRGPATEDAARTNLTVGLHLGHFIGPRVSVGGELRYQRWLTDAAPVRNDPSARQTATVGLGARFHLRLGEQRWLRPGLSYSRALDDPLKRQSYDMVQLDLPVAF